MNGIFAQIPGIKNGSTYDWKGVPAVNYNGGAAQNNQNPLATFQNHVVVIINGQYYDPSYGKIYKDLDDMQQTSIAGFYNIPDLVATKKDMYILKSGKTRYLYETPKTANKP